MPIQFPLDPKADRIPPIADIIRQAMADVKAKGAQVNLTNVKAYLYVVARIHITDAEIIETMMEDFPG